MRVRRRIRPFFGLSLFVASATFIGCSSNDTNTSNNNKPQDAGSSTQPNEPGLDATSPGPGSDSATPEPVVTHVPIFPAGTRISGKSGEPNYNNAKVTVTVPDGEYASAVLRFTVLTGCKGSAPAGQNWPAKCDPFDRTAFITIANTAAGQEPSAIKEVVVLDAITPFGGDKTFENDVTHLLPMLKGENQFSATISTVAVPDGKASGTDAGFDIEVELVLTGGTPAKRSIGVAPLLRRRMTTPDPVEVSFTAPAGAHHAELEFYTTGHSESGSGCDEFCQKEHVVLLDDSEVFRQGPWVKCDDTCTHVPSSRTLSCGGKTFNYTCKENPTSCPSSPPAPRANWCPGKQVVPFMIPLPEAAAAGTHKVSLAIPKIQGYFEVHLNAVFFE